MLSLVTVLPLLQVLLTPGTLGLGAVADQPASSLLRRTYAMASISTVSSRNVLLSSAAPPAPATLRIEGGRVVEVLPRHTPASNATGPTHIDFGDLVIMPGIVDAHVHINEPGRTQWEGFEHATKAAAAGGVTTLIDMPLNAIPPTTTVPNFEHKLKAAEGQCRVDVGFLGGVIPGNEKELRHLIKCGVRGFKCFLTESGVAEFPHVNLQQLRTAAKELSGTDTVLMFHAEVDEPAETRSSSDGVQNVPDPKSYNTFLESRPQSMETRAVSLIIKLAREFPDLRYHIVHLSAGAVLDLVREAKRSGIKLTAETCFHYLTLDAEEIPNGATQFKCCPPIRGRANRDLLWGALKDGTIDYVVSDHSPCTADLKILDQGDFTRAWGGIASVQFGLSVLWTEARQRGATLQDITRWLSENTASQVQLLGKKGRLEPGADADFVVWDPNASFTVSKSSIRFRNKITPYDGRQLYGVVHRTFVRGQVVFDADQKSEVECAILGQLLL